MDAISHDGFADQVLNVPGRVLVDCWAEWCGPCRMIDPVLEDLERENPDVTFLKLNVDEDPGIAQTYEVMSVPTLLAFEGGKVQKRIVGALPKAKLVEELSEFLA